MTRLDEELAFAKGWHDDVPSWVNVPDDGETGKKEPRRPSCCGAVRLKTGEDVYPHRPDLEHLRFWVCDNCRGYVGCHPGTTNPLGRIAGPAERKARNRAHAMFDPLWKSGMFKRKEAYAKLAEFMGIERHRCHIGYFNEGECAKVIEFARTLTASTNNDRLEETP